jgi:hypothetical protein
VDRLGFEWRRFGGGPGIDNVFAGRGDEAVFHHAETGQISTQCGKSGVAPQLLDAHALTSSNRLPIIL